MDPIARRAFLAGTGAAFALRATRAAQAQSTAPAPKPRVSISVREFGATGDGTTLDTAVIQSTIDRCWALGGGDAVVPEGTYLTGAIALKSNVTIRLEQGAVLQGSPNFADYPVTQVRWEGKWIPGHVGLVYAIDASDIGISGPGKIAGSPAVGGRPTQDNALRHPALIEPMNCNGVRFEGFSTEHRLMWSMHAAYCENMVFRNLTIRSTGGNGDGIDIDSCKHVLIDGCDISTGDDCISLKSGRGAEAYALLKTTEDVTITNCTMADAIFACIGIGSETSGGIRNVRIDHCKFTHAHTYALYIKSRPGRGAFIEDITANDLDVTSMDGGFLRFNILASGIQDHDPVPGDEGIPTIKNFRFTNIRLSDCKQLADGTGIHPHKPLDGFVLENVTGSCEKGISLVNIKNARIAGIEVSGLQGPLLGINNVTGTGLEGAVQIAAPKVADDIANPAIPYRLR